MRGITFFSLAPNLSNVLIQSGANICCGHPRRDPPALHISEQFCMWDPPYFSFQRPTILSSATNLWCLSCTLPPTPVYRSPPIFAPQTILVFILTHLLIDHIPSLSVKQYFFFVVFFWFCYKGSEKRVVLPFVCVIVMPVAIWVIGTYGSGKLQRERWSIASRKGEMKHVTRYQNVSAHTSFF